MAKRTPSTLKKIATLMRNLDFCMLTTQTKGGALHSRPMSNNGEVEFDGDVWFFSAAQSRKVREIEATPRVQLAYVDLEQWRFLSMIGRARIVRDPAKKRELWLEELRRWFKDGPDSEAVVLIKVTPTVVSYWTKKGDGELRLKPASRAATVRSARRPRRQPR